MDVGVSLARTASANERRRIAQAQRELMQIELATARDSEELRATEEAISQIKRQHRQQQGGAGAGAIFGKEVPLAKLV